MKFSIVIPTYNNWPAIRQVVPAVLREAGGRADCEILVIDSSTDGSAEKAAEEFKGARVIRPPGRILPGPARNLGADSSTGDILIFLDGDCVVSEGWLSAFESRVDQLSGAIVCGAVDLPLPADASQFLEYLIWKLPENSRVRRGDYGFVITENMMITREKLRSTGGFGDSDSANDAQMDVARRKAGLRIFFEPNARVFHLHRSGLAFQLKKLYRIGQELFELMQTLPEYRVGRIMAYLFPVVFLVRWVRITARVIVYRPTWLPRYVGMQPLLLSGLLLLQAGLWKGLFKRWASPGF